MLGLFKEKWLELRVREMSWRSVLYATVRTLTFSLQWKGEPLEDGEHRGHMIWSGHQLRWERLQMKHLGAGESGVQF